MKATLEEMSQAYAQLLAEWSEKNPPPEGNQFLPAQWVEATKAFEEEVDSLFAGKGWKMRDYQIESRKEAKAMLLQLKQEAEAYQEFP